MTQSCSAPTTATRPLAQLGASLGYRFEGDVVCLNAMFRVLDPLAHQRTWVLQLRACATVPSPTGDPGGHVVAEVVLPPMAEIADETENFEIAPPAEPPAGQQAWTLAFVLATRRDGQADEVHDRFVFPRRETFVQPRLNGVASYRLEGNRATLHVERLANPRAASNLSGTLALELWALPQAYDGGAFRGQPLAGVAFDPLPGQTEWLNRSFDLPCVTPSAGTWNLALMLREWTPRGYVTRDYLNFSAPFHVAAPVAAPAAAVNIATAPTAATPTSVTPPARVAAPLASPASAPVAATAKTAPAPTPSPAPAAQSQAVSVNRASKEELIAVKGLPAKVAEGIVKQRPFKSLEELTRIKGMGARLLERLRTKLRL